MQGQEAAGRRHRQTRATAVGSMLGKGRDENERELQLHPERGRHHTEREPTEFKCLKVH